MSEQSDDSRSGPLEPVPPDGDEASRRDYGRQLAMDNLLANFLPPDRR